MTSPEAPLLRQLNTLKQVDTYTEYLTEEQRDVFETIRSYRENGEPYINLHGPKSAGKTFICWALQEGDWAYHQALPDRVNNPAVIYDHGEYERMATRSLRNNVEMNGVACVLYVTRKVAEEIYPRIEFNPSTAHYKAIANNWDQLGLDPEGAPTITRDNTGDTVP